MLNFNNTNIFLKHNTTNIKIVDFKPAKDTRSWIDKNILRKKYIDNSIVSNRLDLCEVSKGSLGKKNLFAFKKLNSLLGKNNYKILVEKGNSYYIYISTNGKIVGVTERKIF